MDALTLTTASGATLGWHWLTRLGELQIMLPALLVAAWSVRAQAPRLAARWLIATIVVIALTTLSKVAFIGYGWGLAAIDFTGVSGHALMASAVLPLLLLMFGATVWLPVRVAGFVFGVALAVGVAVSRVQLGAHSWSEVIAGFALGAAATGVALEGNALPALRLPRVFVLALAAALPLAVAQAPPSRTHDGVTRLALALSGRPQPYTRWHLHHRPPRPLPARAQPVTSATGAARPAAVRTLSPSA